MPFELAPDARSNPYGDRFLITSEITSADLREAIKRYDACRFDQAFDFFSTVDPKTNLPAAFGMTPDQSAFRWFPADTIARALGERNPGPARELCEQLRSRSDETAVLSRLIGSDIRHLRAAVKPSCTVLRWVDVSEIGRKLGWLSKAKLSPELISDLVNFEAWPRLGIPDHTGYALLTALNAQERLLHPLTLWRCVYSAAGLPSAQKYMEGEFSVHLMGPGRERDMRQLAAEVFSVVRSRFRAGTLRFLQVLATTTFNRLQDWKVDEVLASIASYVTDSGFRERPEPVRSDARKFMLEGTRVLGLILKRHGVEEADKLFLPDSVPNGTTTRQIGKVRKSDGSFKFLITAQHDLSGWPGLLSEYVETSEGVRKRSFVQPLLTFCDWLIAHGSGLEEPQNLTRSDIIETHGATKRQPFLKYLRGRFGSDSAGPAKAFGAARQFYTWYLAREGLSCPNPFQEIDHPSAPEYAGKTSKEALPARIMMMMRETLIADNWKWARERGDDVYRFFDYDKGEEVVTWCPVRAVGLYSLLTIPIRTIQLRLLDSGEFDQQVCVGVGGETIKNPRGIPGRALGVLRAFGAGPGSSSAFTGFYINTNKTARLFGGGKKQGYEIQWECDTLIGAFAMLRDWQSEYNSVDQPIHVNELDDTLLHCPRIVADRVPKYAFLFRDPISLRTSRQQPISRAKLETLFLHLLAEVESQLQAEGLEIELITKWEDRANGSRVPANGVVTLHSLRVSGITNFAEFGVPLHILTEFIAGHASILMNLWYHKYGFSTINHVIKSATGAMGDAAGLEQLRRWAEDRADSEKDLEDIDLDSIGTWGPIAYTSRSGLESLASQDRGLWHIDIDGICPNGRTLCHEGGPTIGTKGWTRSTPVPGGRGNCPLCRFWITGPMFVFGQIVRANVLLYHIQEKAEALQRLEDQLVEIQALVERGDAGVEEIAPIRASIEILNTELENAIQTWVARYRLACESLAAGKKDAGHPTIEGSRHKLLVARSDSLDGLQTSAGKQDPSIELVPASAVELPEIGLQRVHRLSLLEFVNQACELIPSVQAPSAPIRKGKLLDSLLEREGSSPFFFKLSDEESLRVGNQLTRFLASVCSEHGVVDLLAGEKTFRDLGVVLPLADVVQPAKLGDEPSAGPGQAL